MVDRNFFFAISASLFAIGSIPAYLKFVGSSYDSITFFAGSLLFTSAAYLQYIESINAPKSLFELIKQKIKFFTWEPKRIDWWSTLVQ